jgi:hypothetical protein
MPGSEMPLILGRSARSFLIDAARNVAFDDVAVDDHDVAALERKVSYCGRIILVTFGGTWLAIEYMA